MLKAEEEGGGSLRSPNNQRSSGETSRTNSGSSPPRRGDTFLPGQGVISGLRWQELSRACYLGNYDRSTENLSLKILVMMTQKTRETKINCNWLQDWFTTKKNQESTSSSGAKGRQLQAFSSHNSALNSINIGASRWVDASMWMAEIQQSIWWSQRFQMRDKRGNTTSIMSNQRCLMFNNLS